MVSLLLFVLFVHMACKLHATVIVYSACCHAGARSAQSCLWNTARQFPNEWAWFLNDAETHVRYMLNFIYVWTT